MRVLTQWLDRLKEFFRTKKPFFYINSKLINGKWQHKIETNFKNYVEYQDYLNSDIMPKITSKIASNILKEKFGKDYKPQAQPTQQEQKQTVVVPLEEEITCFNMITGSYPYQ